jgi:hypothetical protein
MQRMTPLATVLLAVAAVVTLPSTTSADKSAVRDHYQAVYEQVDRENAGPYPGGLAGRNLADDGVRTANGERRATDGELRDAIGVMERMLSPPPPAPEPTAAPAPATSSTGGYSIPSYIVACESGGDYGASNPSGAYGAYQIMPGTAAAYGCDLSTPAGQDVCAARIYADVGASAWVCG